MAKNITCDACGTTDDWVAYGDELIFPDGAIMKLRSDLGSPDFECEIDLCVDCKSKILLLFPQLIKYLKNEINPRCSLPTIESHQSPID